MRFAIRQRLRASWKLFFCVGGILPSSVLFAASAFADTVVLKNDKELKGLVVERHADRIILSTEKGEVPILLARIRDIVYDAPEQNFFKIGKAYEAEQKLGPALAYYEKALELNPQFEDARKAAMGVKSRFWSIATEGPRSEIEKQQAIYDAWQQGSETEDLIRKKGLQNEDLLRERFGLSIEKRGDWVQIEQAGPSGSAALAGLRRADRLVSIDGESLRYLSSEIVCKNLLEPRFSNFTLEYDRDVSVLTPAPNLKALGIKLKLEYRGLVVRSVKPGMPAHEAGLREGDLVTRVNGTATRYMPMREVAGLVEKSPEGRAVFTVRRSALLARR